MRAEIKTKQISYQIDLSKPIDISIPLRSQKQASLAWGVNPILLEPVKEETWIGDTRKGGPVNFKNVTLNPHGNGTHTECIGHITKKQYSVNKLFKQTFSLAELISLDPEEQNKDKVITKSLIEKKLSFKTDTIIIRTLPNTQAKLRTNYTNTNPTYLHHRAAKLLNKKSIKHLLIDTPSIDKEKDGGAILAHKAYWGYPNNKRLDAFITEMIYVPSKIKDGLFFLNTQIAPLELDATPSKPLLFEILK